MKDKDLIYKEKRKKRKLYAEEHTREMERLYSFEIERCVLTTIQFTEDIIFPEPIKNTKDSIPAIALVDQTTGECIKNSDYKDGLTILNFASFKYPGGGFIVGTNAQEENLCQESFLYNILKEFDSTWYEHNRKDTNRSLYYNRALYSKDVIFHESKSCDVITCACPNFKGFDALDNSLEMSNKEANSRALHDRIEFILNICAHMNVHNVILGAFGCGVFKQDPTEVATIFKQLLTDNYYGLKNVIFAIPDKEGVNYKAFEKVLM